MALEHPCKTCKSLKAGSLSSGQVPPAATHGHGLPKAWQVLGLDAFEWTVPGLKKKARFLLISGSTCFSCHKGSSTRKYTTPLGTLRSSPG